MKLKKLTSIIFICVLAISVVACTSSNEEKSNKEDKTVVEGNEDQDKNQDKESTAVKGKENQDKELTDELLKEKEVFNGQLYVDDEWAKGAIIIKDGVSEEKAKEIAEKYAKELKDKYKDKKVNVQAVNSNGNIANIEL